MAQYAAMLTGNDGERIWFLKFWGYFQSSLLNERQLRGHFLQGENPEGGREKSFTADRPSGGRTATLSKNTHSVSGFSKPRQELDCGLLVSQSNTATTS